MHDTCMATLSVVHDVQVSDVMAKQVGGIKSGSTVPSVFAGRAWQQVLARDTSADGQFFYGVKSTGVYCKPSCPSRRPERKNVSFYPTQAAAEAAGFRACLRCEPQDRKSVV